MRVTIAMAAALQVWLSVSASAAELSPELRGLIEGFQTHRRAAVGYLRTQNGDLAAVEIERLRDRLAAGRAAGPSALTDTAFAIAMARTEGLVAAALKVADEGDIERARALLEEAGRPIDGWREANGIRLFSDCILEISAAYGALDIHRVTPPDRGDAAAGPRIVAATRRVTGALDRCEHEASSGMRTAPEFRRLFDGMREGLRQIPDAVTARDGALLHRLLIEQRAFEQLLLFRFG